MSNSNQKQHKYISILFDGTNMDGGESSNSSANTPSTSIWRIYNDECYWPGKATITIVKYINGIGRTSNKYSHKTFYDGKLVLEKEISENCCGKFGDYYRNSTKNSLWENIISIVMRIDILTGRDCNVKIKEAYQLLCNHYNTGDNVCLFGFSRGGFTAVSFAGFIHEIGILPNELVDHKIDNKVWYIDALYDAYIFSRETFINTIKILRNNILIEGIKTHFVGLFDPVISIDYKTNPDVIKIASTTHKSIGHQNRIKISGHTIVPPEFITHFRSAIAVHEFRNKFEPMLYKTNCDRENPTNTSPSNTPIDIIQMLFPGNHSDIGGSNNVFVSRRVYNYMKDEFNAVMKVDHKRELLEDETSWISEGSINSTINFNDSLLQEIFLDEKQRAGIGLLLKDKECTLWIDPYYYVWRMLKDRVPMNNGSLHDLITSIDATIDKYSCGIHGTVIKKLILLLTPDLIYKVNLDHSESNGSDERSCFVNLSFLKLNEERINNLEIEAIPICRKFIRK